MRIGRLCFFLILTGNFCQAQGAFPCINKVYKDNIKSFTLYVAPVPTSDPIMPLGSTACFRFSFDELGTDFHNYYYTVQLCNADWTLADLPSSEYLTGFQDQQLFNYKSSFNTLQPYVHYADSFPRPDFQMKKSGNYLLRIYADNDPSQVVATARFMLYDAKVEIQSTIHQPLDMNWNDSHQQLDCSVLFHGFSVSNPWDDVKLVMMQNFRWDGAVTLKPLFVKNEELDYHYNKENIFSGGKEYRSFDTRELRYKGFHVYDIREPDNALTEVTLYADQPKVYQKYTFETDINGKRVIDRAQSTDPELEADYCYVNFFLPVTSPFSGGRLYVYGQLSNWDTLADCRMKYDEKLRGYECWTLLKQGFYNYQYVFVDDQLKTADPSVVEGDSWETENDYDILVYYHAPGDRYDQLIGFKRTNSLRP